MGIRRGLGLAGCLVLVACGGSSDEGATGRACATDSDCKLTRVCRAGTCREADEAADANFDGGRDDSSSPTDTLSPPDTSSPLDTASTDTGGAPLDSSS